MPVFVNDDRLRSPSGANRLAFLEAALSSLDADIGGHLVIRSGDPAAVLAEIAAETGAKAIYATDDYAPYGRKRDDRVGETLAAAGLVVHYRDSPYAVDHRTRTAGGGTPFKVFTPFFSQALEGPRLARNPPGGSRPIGSKTVDREELHATRQRHRSCRSKRESRRHGNGPTRSRRSGVPLRRYTERSQRRRHVTTLTRLEVGHDPSAATAGPPRCRPIRRSVSFGALLARVLRRRAVPAPPRTARSSYHHQDGEHGGRHRCGRR